MAMIFQGTTFCPTVHIMMYTALQNLCAVGTSWNTAAFDNNHLLLVFYSRRYWYCCIGQQKQHADLCTLTALLGITIQGGVAVHCAQQENSAWCIDLAAPMGLIGVHLLVVYLNSTRVQPGSRNVLAVAMDLAGVRPTSCAPNSSLLEFYTSTDY